MQRYKIEQERQDFRIGLLCATVVNVAPFMKHDKVFQPRDFMPQTGHARRSPEGLLEKAKLLNAMLGGRVDNG